MKRKIDVKKPKGQTRLGFETMEPIHNQNELGAYRFYFKGAITVFEVVDRKHHQIDGVPGILLELRRAKGTIFYNAFERGDGVCFFLGESESQLVDQSVRNLDYIRADKFN